MPVIERIAELDPEVREAITAPLDTFSRERGFVWQPEPLALALRDDEGRVAGGAIGETNWGWLHIRILAVSEALRGQDWGSRLIRELERLAVERGCHHTWVDTFSFQARPFYERLGYRVFGTLPDYPVGHERYFLSKSLLPSASTPAI
ncbi:acetyltransferase : Acetyltransferase OS=Singulisphaera acidiphila (strain ATCC BAA-1392 / DSM 18658 / VKM B-2454 / MOB10) GN=Sinac_4568 PE=4 SV=1: Acetyltransf_1 [Gemmata massiliana]|uniref:N-acetyltransferase domain-containing protein n=1 Tax=Gemmata massiliana TaxID=1210884 RepID=A0A6P2DQQ8_9BACT|nr:GNAT family N-acetyltransferase [Gemmata massiliana]VTS03858.1 acetyltransferase : Acetyltransferase OS=Singulisphaera acidiphila (strain ATCC BAA-1392 / DSM 18658 / VKM B-2454 / MOB10) GN=Sinac_4568 PE=4 SV=1: Acetyltransf_1 [Gemmata massiliana]